MIDEFLKVTPAMHGANHAYFGSLHEQHKITAADHDELMVLAEKNVHDTVAVLLKRKLEDPAAPQTMYAAMTVGNSKLLRMQRALAARVTELETVSEKHQNELDTLRATQMQHTATIYDVEAAIHACEPKIVDLEILGDSNTESMRLQRRSLKHIDAKIGAIQTYLEIPPITMQELIAANESRVNSSMGFAVAEGDHHLNLVEAVFEQHHELERHIDQTRGRLNQVEDENFAFQDMTTAGLDEAHAEIKKAHAKSASIATELDSVRAAFQAENTELRTQLMQLTVELQKMKLHLGVAASASS